MPLRLQIYSCKALAAVSFKLTVAVTEIGNNWNILNQLTVTVTVTENNWNTSNCNWFVTVTEIKK